jgi:hypothetical protein
VQCAVPNCRRKDSLEKMKQFGISVIIYCQEAYGLHTRPQKHHGRAQHKPAITGARERLGLSDDLEQRKSKIMNTRAHRESFARTSIRTAIGFGALAPLLLVAAGTASADPPNGTYDVETPQGQIGEWTITSCGPGCAHIQAGGGVKKVDLDIVGGGWIADTRVSNGKWSFSGTADYSVTCPDKTRVSQSQSYTVDPATMTGTVTVLTGSCAEHGGSDSPQFSRPITLTKM